MGWDGMTVATAHALEVEVQSMSLLVAPGPFASPATMKAPTSGASNQGQLLGGTGTPCPHFHKDCDILSAARAWLV
jgi:hypothetical protein